MSCEDTDQKRSTASPWQFWQERPNKRYLSGINMEVLSRTFCMTCYQKLYMWNRRLLWQWLAFQKLYRDQRLVIFLKSLKRERDCNLMKWIPESLVVVNYWNLRLISNAYLNDIHTGIAKVWCQSEEIVQTFLYVDRSMCVTSKGFQQLTFRSNTSHLPSDFCQYYALKCLNLWK